MNLTELSRALHTLRSNIEGGAILTAIHQVSDLINKVDAEQAEVEAELLRIRTAEANRFSYRQEESMIDLSAAFAVLQTVPFVEYEFKVIEQVRYHGINFQFDDWKIVNETSAAKAATLNEHHMDKWQDRVSSDVDRDDAADVPGWWMLIGLIGTNPPQEMLDAFLDGRLRIQDLHPNIAHEIFSDWPAFLLNPEKYQDQLEVEVEEGYDS